MVRRSACVKTKQSKINKQQNVCTDVRIHISAHAGIFSLNLDLYLDIYSVHQHHLLLHLVFLKNCYCVANLN